MEIKRLNPGDGEQIFMTFRNSDTTALSAGWWAAYDTVSDQDGVGVDKPAGVLLNKIAGVCLTALAAGAYGKFQIWGPCTIAKAKGGTQIGTNDLTAGVPLAIATSGFYPTRFLANSAAAKADYAKQGSIGYPMGCSTAANYSASTSSVYTVFVTCL
jgi:hypothetical protein